MLTYLHLACRILRSALRSHFDVALENLALQQQLMVLTRSSRRPRLTPADRLFWSWISRIWSPWRSALVLVQPDTVVRWHRKGSRLLWPWRSRNGKGGRPRILRRDIELIKRISRMDRRYTTSPYTLCSILVQVKGRRAHNKMLRILGSYCFPSWRRFAPTGVRKTPKQLVDFRRLPQKSL